MREPRRRTSESGTEPPTCDSESEGSPESDLAAPAASLGSALLRGGASPVPAPPRDFDGRERLSDPLGSPISGSTAEPPASALPEHELEEPDARGVADAGEIEDAELSVITKLVGRVAASDGERRLVSELVSMGERAAGPLLDALRNEPTAQGKLRLGEALVALGDHAVPAVRRRLAAADDADEIRAAVQLAGAIQSRSLVDSLRSILYCGDASLRAEAAESLARVGGSQAAAALAEAMASSVEGVAEAAARGVGALALRGDGGSHDPLSVLLGTLDHAVASCDVPLAREVMRALARMHASEAVPALTHLLHRAPLLRRSRHRSLQRLAIETLARLPDERAGDALETVARRGRRHLRRYARKRLAERASRTTANDPKAEPLQ